MKKNAFLTFIFACIPGAGQMYYGYMKRGTSLLVYFCLFIMLGAIISPAENPEAYLSAAGEYAIEKAFLSRPPLVVSFKVSALTKE